MSNRHSVKDDAETVKLVSSGISRDHEGSSASCRNRSKPILLLLMVFFGCFGGSFVAVTITSKSLAEVSGDSDNNGSNVSYADEKKKHSEHVEIVDVEEPKQFVSAKHEQMHKIIDDYIQDSGLSQAKADFLHKQNDELHKSGKFDDNGIPDNLNDIMGNVVLHETLPWVNPKSKVGQIVLIGERNTGTRWVTRLLASCFPDIYVSSTLTRWKHWFQYDDNLEHPPTLVVSTFLNPYDWVENMRLVPHDQPNHMFQIPFDEIDFTMTDRPQIDWKTFVTRPWTMTRPIRDFDFSNSTGNICQYNFGFNEVIPCTMDPEVVKKRLRNGALSAIAISKQTKNSFLDIHSTNVKKAGAGMRTPCYELKRDGSGDPYDSILDMRSDKILNHFAVKDYKWVVDFVPVTYESVVEDGPWPLLKRVEDIVGIKAQCSNLPLPKSLARETIPDEMIQFISENINWKTEELLGYKKRI